MSSDLTREDLTREDLDNAGLSWVLQPKNIGCGSSKGLVVHGDNLQVMRLMPDGCVNLVYVDPPFNTGKTQKMKRVSSGVASGEQLEFIDVFDDYLSFMKPRLAEAIRLLASNGTMYVHVDYREVHYLKVMIDSMMGRECFLNEVIWAYDYGGRSKKKWPPKHDNILVYVKNPKDYVFNRDAIDRIPYMAPSLVGAEKAKAGKTPTDTWWHTIVPTMGKERTGYPTQKPEGILKRVILASSNPGDLVMDFFAGSGTTGAVAAAHGRRFVLIDKNPHAISVIVKRMSALGFDHGTLSAFNMQKKV